MNDLKLYLEIEFDPNALDEAKELVEQARGFGTVRKAEVVIRAETRINLQ